MPRMRQQAKQRISEPIPISILRWAKILVKTGDWGRALRDSGVNPFMVLDEELAPVLIRAVKAGEIEVSETAKMDNFQICALMERLTQAP